MGANCCRSDAGEDIIDASMPGVTQVADMEEKDGVQNLALAPRRKKKVSTIADMTWLAEGLDKERDELGRPRMARSVSTGSNPEGAARLHSNPGVPGELPATRNMKRCTTGVNSGSAILNRSRFDSNAGGLKGASADFLAEIQARMQDKKELDRDQSSRRGRRRDSFQATGILAGIKPKAVNRRVSFLKRSATNVDDVVDMDSDIESQTKNGVGDDSPAPTGADSDTGSATPRSSARGEKSPRVRPDKKAMLKRSNSLISEIGRGASMALQIMVENPRDISKVYQISRTLGKGNFGTVRHTRVRATGASRAVKSIHKGAIGDSLSMLKMEMKITKMVDHPNIVKLYEIFEDALNLYLVMEICLGFTLKKRVDAAKTHLKALPEQHAAICMQQVLRSILYLHNNCICHRDLKLENILLTTDEPLEKCRLKLTDFGVSCVFKPGQILKARVGTPDYMAPEVIGRKYDMSCDIWSCGVLMHALFDGKTPFTGKDKEDTFARILTGRFSFGTGWVDASQGAIDFITLLLMVDTKNRITASQALQHSWFVKSLPASRDVQLSPNFFTCLVKFKQQNRFFRASGCLIASLLSKEEIQVMDEAFAILDSDGDGIVTAADVKGKLKTMLAEAQARGKEVMQIKKLIAEVDKGLDPYTYTEFLAATFDRQKHLQEGVCKAAFSAFDQDADGHVTLEELASGSLLGHLKTSELMKLVEECDLNGDGSIDFNEFQIMMKQGF